MPQIVVEAECIAAVVLDGNELSLLKIEGESITANLQPSRGRLVRGKFYRVTFDEIEGPPQC